VATDGEEAIEFLDWIEATPGIPCPDLVLLDINLPKRMGGEVIHAFKNNNRCGATPVLIVTSSNSPEERRAMEASGAAGHFRKPSDYREYMKLGQIVRDILRREEA
jgi:CheY-like chemotaxis protein